MNAAAGIVIRHRVNALEAKARTPEPEAAR